MIGRVLDAFRAELSKLAHRRIGHAAFLAAFVAVLLAAGLAKLGEQATRLQAGEKAAVAANGFVVFADGLGYGVGFGSIFLLIFAGLFMAEETELGTAKILFSKPVKRSEIVLAKGLLLLVLSVALVLFVAAASAGVAGAFFGFGDVVERSASGEVMYTYHTTQEMVGHAARAVPQLVLPLFASLAIAFVMSALADQSGIAVGLSFGILVVSMVGTWLSSRAAPYLVTSYFGFAPEMLRAFATGESTADWAARWGGAKGPPKLLLGLAVCLATAGVCWGVATVAVSRRAILALALSASVATALLAGPGAAAALAAEKPAFAIQELETTGQVWSVTAKDVDGDGRVDLVAFHVTGRRGSEPRRFISIFYQGERGFAKAPAQTFEIPQGAVARFVADVDPASPGLEIGYIGTHGASCLTAKKRVFDAARPKRLFDDESFYDIAAGTQLPDWDPLVRDVDADGRADIFFPRKGTFALWRQAADGTFARGVELAMEYNQRFGARIESLLLNRFISYYAGLSKPALTDADGTKRLDVVTFRDNALEVFLQKPGTPALYGRDPDRRMPLKVMTDQQSEGGGADDSYNQVNAEFADVDQDSLADLVLYRNVGKVGLFESMRTQVLFYRAREKQGWNPDQPDQIVNLKGLSINPALIDVDKDGDKDLVVSSLRTDLVTNAKRALFSSVSITYYVFRFDGKTKRFADVPAYSKDLTIDVARIEGGGTIPVANFEGDYDGDGVPDLLSLESAEEVRILPGKVDDGWFGGDKLDYDEGEEVVLKMETSNSIEVVDLNRDAKSDFLFWYFDANWESKERGLIRVAMSK